MRLLHDVVEVLPLPEADGGAVFLVVARDRGFMGVAAVNGDRLGEPVAADRLLQKPPRGLFVPRLGEPKVKGLAVFVHHPIQRAPLAFDLTYQRPPIRMTFGGKWAPLQLIAIVTLPHDAQLLREE